jgi:N-methylhydantoinase A
MRTIIADSDPSPATIGDYRIGVDVGGTFTDVCIEDRHRGQVTVAKRLSAAPDPTPGLRAALEEGAHQLGFSLAELLRASRLLVYGTTIATNAILTAGTAATGLLCTAGFRDILWIREGGKDDPFEWRSDYPRPFVPRRLVRPIAGRISSEGAELEPLDEDDVAEAVEVLRGANVDAIAVAYLWSFANPAHELTTAAIIRRRWPGVHCVLSHQVNPTPREYRRTIATTIDASLHSTVARHLDAVASMLRDAGFAGVLLGAGSHGGVMPFSELRRRPILTVGSGPTMAPVAASCAAAEEGWASANLLIGDMGGTSFDVSVIKDGRVRFSRETKAGPDLLGIARIDIRSIGAGGGSIAWIDDGGLLRVGPESAGADPGPACYGPPGRHCRPTVTDADLLLGRLGARPPTAGLVLSVAAAEAAVAPIAIALGCDVPTAAELICATVNQAMVNEIESLAVREGLDLETTLLVAGGGACGLHVAEIATELGVRRVLIPRYAGTLTAFGALVSDIGNDFSTGYHMRSDALDLEHLGAVLSQLRAAGFAFLEQARAPRETWSLTGTCEARYVGQVWELDVPMPSVTADAWMVRELIASFHALHERVYGVAQPGEPVEFLLWRVRATSSRTPAEPARAAGPVALEPAMVREVFIDEGFRPTRIHTGRSLGATGSAGPVVIEEGTTTIYVPPSWTIARGAAGNYLLSRDA